MEKPAIDPLLKQKVARKNWGQLNNRPHDVVHNHDSPPDVVYAGFCPTAPKYHLWRCVKLSEPPRKAVALRDFDQSRFVSKSKAGRGGCSMRFCPGEARFMDEAETQGYCERCAKRAQGYIPCMWTSILPCPYLLGLDEQPYNTPCPTCAAVGLAA